MAPKFQSVHQPPQTQARVSDFALAVRKAVAADALPEYALQLGIDATGDEVVTFRRREEPARQLPPAEADRASPATRRRAAVGRRGGG
jgi:hypothetical protein